MKNRITTGIFFFLFLLTASGVFAAMVENSHQGSLAISVTSQPGSTENAEETHQGLICIILNPVSVGAFTTKDPIGFNGGNNLYRYADNNPIRWVDPFGLLTEAECERLQQEISKWQGVKPLLVNMFKTYKEGTTWEDYGLKVLSNAAGYRTKEFNELPAFIRNVLNEQVYSISNNVLQSLMLGWVGTSMLLEGNIENSLFGGPTGIVQFWKVRVCMEYYRTNLVIEELTKLFEEECKEGCE